MKPPEDFESVVNRKRYSTKTAVLLAGDDYWDGHNFERSVRNTFLDRTPKGAYFSVTLTKYQGEHASIKPLLESEEYQIYETVTEKRIPGKRGVPGHQDRGCMTT